MYSVNQLGIIEYTLSNGLTLPIDGFGADYCERMLLVQKNIAIKNGWNHDEIEDTFAEHYIDPLQYMGDTIIVLGK